MSTNLTVYLCEPIAQKYVLEKEYEKTNRVRFNLAMLLVKLGVWPWLEYHGKYYPLSPEASRFHEVLAERRIVRRWWERTDV